MVPLINVAEPLIGDEEKRKVAEVLESGYFVQGPLVAEFEEKWADYCGVKHAIAVNSGTAALHVALDAAGVGPGDEVIIPPLSFVSTGTAVLHQNAVPVFADIQEDIYCLDPQDFERKITDRTKAVIPVHIYGHPAEMDEINEIAEEHDVAVIEDAAQAHGAEYRGDKVGALGDAGCFSFYATKNITTGEGGVITTDSDDLAERARTVRNHGMVDRDHHDILGYNYRMSELNAAIGIPQIDKLDDLNRRRRENSYQLIEELRDLEWVKAPEIRDYVEHAFFWAPFLVDEEMIGMTAKQVRAELIERGVEVRHRYVDPMYNQKVFTSMDAYGNGCPWKCSPNEGSDVDYTDSRCPTTENIVGRMIGPPNHPGLTGEELDTVVNILRNFR